MAFAGSLLAASGAAVALVAAADPAGPPAPPSALFAKPWNAGVAADEPAFQSQAIDADTFAIRQSLKTSFEGPFLYLLFGRDRALLVDSGADGASARTEVDRLIAEWLRARGRKSIPLVVMHSHGHGDHVAGDKDFAARPDTRVVGRTPEEVAAFFGLTAWPAGAATFDLGGRAVEVIPTPGHHPSHVMVFDPRTRILFSGDAVYPGRLYFQCGRTAEYLASIERVARLARDKGVRWVLGAHIEMRTTPGRTFEGQDRARRDEHVLELKPAVLEEIRAAVAGMGARPRVEPHSEFVVFPHPADPRGKAPPDWCDAER